MSVLLGLSTGPLPNDSGVVDVMADPSAQIVELRASEFRFDPERLTVKPGVIRFVIHNVGELRHVLTVEWRGGIGGASIRISPGQTQTLEVTLEQPGTYVFHRPLEDEGKGGTLIVHREKGMEGQLSVVNRSP